MAVQSTRVKRNDVDPTTMWRFENQPLVMGQKPEGVAITQYGPVRWLAWSGDRLSLRPGTEDRAEDFKVHRVAYHGLLELRYKEETLEWVVEGDYIRRVNGPIGNDRPTHEARRDINDMARALAPRIMTDEVAAVAYHADVSSKRDDALKAYADATAAAQKAGQQAEELFGKARSMEELLFSLGINKC
jgi:hypothetical protein